MAAIVETKPRRMFVCGNWRSNLLQAEALGLARALNGLDTSDVEVVVAPVSLHLPLVQERLKRAIAVAAQDCGAFGNGAYTGEVSAEQLAGMEVPWVILGAAERRARAGEDGAALAAKLEQALTAGLRVVFCVGETAAERGAGRAGEACAAQLAGVLHLLNPARVVLAYEPAGAAATPRQAQEAHRAIRAAVAAGRSAAVAAELRIAYGGAASGAGCAELAALPDVDGFYVGAASLQPAAFADIVRACAGRSDAFGPFMLDLVAYPALAAATLVPAVVQVHPYAHMVALASTIVYVGCHRALAQSRLSPGASTAETVTRKEAMQFPLYGSAVLVGLYAVVKLVKKEYLNVLIALYFLVLGAGAVQQALRAPLQRLPWVRGLKTHVWQVKLQFWDKSAVAERVEFNALDVPLLLLGLCLSAAYAATKRWLLANCLAVCFSVCAVEMLALGSFQIGCILLSALFAYDIFWVFGTEVMVTVAKGIDAPIKLLFPKQLGAAKMEFSLLGLGDIVIPGIFVAMMLRFDAARKLRSLPYFRANMAAYVLALVTTVAVMHVFEAAQPALLYLVPGCLGAAFATAAARGELGALWRFSEEEEAGESAAGAAAAKKGE